MGAGTRKHWAGCNAFTYVPSASGGVRRMYWKMSIDLSRPLVSSMGQHDPLDGYVTALQLESTEARPPDSVSEPSLEHEISQFAAMIESEALATADPLGLGGLLTDAYRLEQLIGQGAPADRRLLETLLAASLKGLHHYARSGDQQLPANQRLAFRELGLAIGLRGAERLWHAAQSAPARALLSDGARTRLKALMQYAPLGQEIEAFWREPEHRNVRTWVEHRDINEVMLATSLAPDGFLVLLSPD